ncbi:MAG: tRNA lysidine(34) synthetase TilS [Syntrophaceae bacterium]|nr:tRNA lysidine(34) synthetase TilS [Syntrophaceae bacterium]
MVALSGGPDSVALLDSLVKIAPKMNLSLFVAHYNHSLRGNESEKDEKFCRKLAESYGLPYLRGKMDVTKKQNGESPEDFYRRQRYAFLNKVANKNQAHKIALGHNLQDQAHTVLLRLVRGSSLEGLKGIEPIRENKYIRPLIEVSRREIMEYLSKNNISYRKDRSNNDEKYLRNKIRARLIPLLKKKFNPKIEEDLAQTAKILRVEDDFIKSHVVQARQSDYIIKNETGVRMNVDYLLGLHAALRSRLFKNVLDDIITSKQAVTSKHINNVESILRNNVSGKRVSLPGSFIARREYNILIFERKKPTKEKREYEYELKVGKSFYIKERNVDVFLKKMRPINIDCKADDKIYMDFDKVSPPLVLRNRRNGDWIEPLGMKGRKKIKDYLIDEKVPRALRDKMMLIADADSVAWIEKKRLSERVKITSKTKNILEVRIIDKEGNDRFATKKGRG